MTQRSGEQPHVLVVEDEPSLAELYETWLSDDYDVTKAIGGAAALATVSFDVDVVLLDRRMPAMSGDETLARLREIGVDAPVAMVTAVEPSSDVVELPFDDYLCKPASREKVLDLVEQLLERAQYDKEARRHFELARKIGLLETHLSADELEVSTTYAELKSQFNTLNAELGARLNDCSAAELRAVIAGR